MKKFFKVALLTGLFAGTGDILSAYISVFIRTGNFPEKMYRYIAGGGLGLETSMKGHVGTALLGLFFHYFIAVSFTFFFFWIFPRLKFLSYNRYLVGMLYAVFVNLAMRFLILPLTPLPAPGEFILERQFIDWIFLGIVLGIPIVYNTYRFYGVNDSPWPARAK